MAKETVATLTTRVEELEAQLSQLLHVNQYQAYALNDALKRIKHAHGRLDAARDVIRGLKGQSAQTTQTRKPAPARKAQTRVECTVEGCPGHTGQNPERTARNHANYVASKA